jgi:cytochrome c6
LKKILISLVTIVTILASLMTNPALAGNIEHGKQLFGSNCASCHAGGKNVVNPQKTLSLADLEANSKNSAAAITTQITKGAGAMPAFAGRLSPSDIEDVTSYIFSQAQNGWAK